MPSVRRSDTPKERSQLEREIVKYAMQRLKIWKREHPNGMYPEGHPQAMRHKCGRKMIEACLALEKLNGK